MRDEEDSICELIDSIKRQSRRPDEVILVDGGSTDRTVETAKECIGEDGSFRILEIGPASPGRGRNEGIAVASNDLIALTDAGIALETRWLEHLESKIEGGSGTNSNSLCFVVYGAYSPWIRNFFDLVATFAYVPPLEKTGIRGRSIASCLISKEVWREVGGFPDLRAAEDLFFMEKVEEAGIQHCYAPDAVISWRLRPDVASTYRKFEIYSFHNVLAGRQWDWHFGILRQYLLLLPVLLLVLMHSPWWLMVLPAWMLARAVKRISAHRSEFGAVYLFKPAYVFGVVGLILLIDLATFVGWCKAGFRPG
ncbi:MAG TPA: glycosyltransferase [Aridibacter sp.]|nr:glycosyltransferase [Aridibacter sp.]